MKLFSSVFFIRALQCYVFRFYSEPTGPSVWKCKRLIGWFGGEGFVQLLTRFALLNPIKRLVAASRLTQAADQTDLMRDGEETSPATLLPQRFSCCSNPDPFLLLVTSFQTCLHTNSGYRADENKIL